MNTLSSDDLVKVLQFLPGRDVLRFFRLNKSFANLVQKHRRILPKPNITVALKYEFQNESIEIKITTFKRNFVLYSDDDLHHLCKPENACGIFGSSDELYKIFTDKFGFEPELNKVLDWIFSNADVEMLHLQSLGRLTLCVMEAITNSKSRCFAIHCHFFFSENNVEKMDSVCGNFCNNQRKFGVSIKLDGIVLQDYLFSTSKLPILCGKLFQEAKFYYAKDSFFKFFQWASKEWEKGKLTAQNAHCIRIRLHRVIESLRAASVRLSEISRIIHQPWSPIPYRFSKLDEDNVTEVVLKNHDEELRIQYKSEEWTFLLTVQVLSCL